MKGFFISIFVFTGLLTFGQAPGEPKFGKVTAGDFSLKSNSSDASAEAIVLFDIGNTQIKGNRKGGLSLEFKRLKRVLIINKSGYNQAKVSIELYTQGEREEQLDNLRAATYNLENGEVEVTKVEPSTSLFKEKKDKFTIVKKFAFPQVKEGSIIEYEYKITSDFVFNLQPWYFQDMIPVLWSEYTVAIPQFLNYILVGQGTQSFYTREQNDKSGTFSLFLPKENSAYGGSDNNGETVNITCGVTEFRWGMKNTPPLKEEIYSSTVLNYMSKLEFQFAGYKDPLVERKVLSTWPDMIKTILESEDFGAELQKAPSWITSELPALLGGANTESEKAKRIHAFLRDNFICKTYYQLFTETSLKDVYNKKTGGVAEINLLLTAMLRSAGITADPVLLSRKENGIIYPRYPVLRRFNYVICRAVIEGREYLLDASQPKLGFGKIDPGCYNGLAKAADAAATDITLRPEQLLEKPKTTVQLSFDGKGKWSGKLITQQGYFESLATRRKIGSDGQEALLKQLQSDDADFVISNMVIDSLPALELPVILRYDISKPEEVADIIYLNPLVTGKYKQNPFQSPSRLYPVETPYMVDRLYTITIAVPEGYKAEEIPKPQVIKMPGDAAVFTCKSSIGGSSIKISYQLELNKTNFPASEYAELREFFNQVVAKQAEQVVLKKI